MNMFVEDAIEILSGTGPRKVNIRLDAKDKTIIRSIQKQISTNVGLTDRQLFMILKKIEKYQSGLELNSVNVEEMIADPKTKLPLRNIERLNSLEIFDDTVTNQKFLIFKHQKNPEIMDRWKLVSELIVGKVNETYGQKIVHCIDINLKLFFDNFMDFDLILDQEITSLFEEFQKIQEERNLHLPRLAKIGENYEILNFKGPIEEIFGKNAVRPDIKTLAKLKNLGISIDDDILDGLNLQDELHYKILKEKTTKIRIKPENHSIESLIDAILALGQDTILFVVDTDLEVLNNVKRIYEAMKDRIDKKQMTVFFRLESNHEKSREFADFVKSNELNNFVDKNSKVVIIERQRISKPLLKSDWHPGTAVVISQYEYGKISVLLNDIQNVYYYNDGFFCLRRNNIAQL